ncbi:hypothetical protein [Anaerocolumna xylanovorans]|uniref:Uncharacterized protein n=1 Tax=Anaerocolumna xylanovorans DSM 12503 TaxID=1121345 RepID=A0A1M7YLB3_9FIRM|nr:hypothetical protein [Anaerocolumna xylanovorans]SHO53394.1 hypothetical protein SAMN02745217_04101 [Anaerocolumna xylanovorans DSM 12503]
MKCISAYLWELKEVHKKIQNEPLTKEEQEEIIRVYNQVVNLCRTADTSGIEIFDMQKIKIKQMNCERILFELAGYVANNMKPDSFEEAAFSRLLTLEKSQSYEILLYLIYLGGIHFLSAQLDYISIGVQLRAMLPEEIAVKLAEEA